MVRSLKVHEFSWRYREYLPLELQQLNDIRSRRLESHIKGLRSFCEDLWMKISDDFETGEPSSRRTFKALKDVTSMLGLKRIRLLNAMYSMSGRSVLGKGFYFDLDDIVCDYLPEKMASILYYDLRDLRNLFPHSDDDGEEEFGDMRFLKTLIGHWIDMLFEFTPDRKFSPDDWTPRDICHKLFQVHGSKQWRAGGLAYRLHELGLDTAPPTMEQYDQRHARRCWSTLGRWRQLSGFTVEELLSLSKHYGLEGVSYLIGGESAENALAPAYSLDTDN